MKGFAGTMANVGLAIREAVQANQAAKDKEEDRKKVASKWLPDSTFVMRVLSAENGWDTPGIPELNNPFAAKLFEMKILQAIQFVVHAKAKDDGWSGCILLKSGLSKFLKRGPIAENIHKAPSGFSVLLLLPATTTLPTPRVTMNHTLCMCCARPTAMARCQMTWLRLLVNFTSLCRHAHSERGNS